MKLAILSAMALAASAIGSAAYAEGFEELCLRVSDDWGTEGDVSGQCSCLAEKSSADPALEAELTSLAETQTSDAAAYDAGSDAVRAAFDACSVNS